MKQRYFLKHRVTKSFILLCLTFIAQFANAKAETWTAKWIWTSDMGPNNVWVDMRKKVTLTEIPATAITRIAAENKYWLYINDSLIIRDGGLETRPNLNDTYYDEIDLAPYLKAGDNIISALVWHRGGPDCYTQRTLANGGFLFDSQLTGSSISTIVSDNTWKVKVDSAFIRGIYLYKYGVTGTIKFDGTTFGGDPIWGSLKSGYYRPVGSSGPFIRCADENASFTLPDTLCKSGNSSYIHFHKHNYYRKPGHQYSRYSLLKTECTRWYYYSYHFKRFLLSGLCDQRRCTGI